MSNKLLLKSFLIVLTIIGSTSSAAIFVWTDANGKKHFSDQKPETELEFEDITKSIKTHTRKSNRQSTTATSPCSVTHASCSAQVKSSYNAQAKSCRSSSNPVSGQAGLKSCLQKANAARSSAMNSCNRDQSMCLTKD